MKTIQLLLTKINNYLKNRHYEYEHAFGHGAIFMIGGFLGAFLFWLFLVDITVLIPENFLIAIATLLSVIFGSASTYILQNHRDKRVELKRNKEQTIVELIKLGKVVSYLSTHKKDIVDESYSTTHPFIEMSVSSVRDMKVKVEDSCFLWAFKGEKIKILRTFTMRLESYRSLLQGIEDYNDEHTIAESILSSKGFIDIKNKSAEDLHSILESKVYYRLITLHTQITEHIDDLIKELRESGFLIASHLIEQYPDMKDDLKYI